MFLVLTFKFYKRSIHFIVKKPVVEISVLQWHTISFVVINIELQQETKCREIYYNELEIYGLQSKDNHYFVATYSYLAIIKILG